MMKQTVIHNYRNIHPIMNQIDRLYTSISADEEDIKPLFGEVTYDESFKALFEILTSNIYYVKQPKLVNSGLGGLSLANPKEDNIVVCVSGGKDSLATVYYFLNKNFNVYLYHIKGINKVYSDEWVAVERIAKELNLPLYIEEVSLAGIHSFVEHPMKNMIIANGALSYAYRENIGTKIAFGNYWDSHLEDNPFQVCAGDCIEMWLAYNDIITKFMPQASIHIPLMNIQMTYKLLERHLDMIPYTISCMSPYRFRKHWRGRTMKSYNVELMENRCGCCWKCAYEYIYLTDHNYQALDTAYYLHCMIILYNTIIKETGEHPASLSDVYNYYFMHDISTSICEKELRDGIIRGNKVIHKPEPEK